jgi:hypothetical protein
VSPVVISSVTVLPVEVGDDVAADDDEGDDEEDEVTLIPVVPPVVPQLNCVNSKEIPVKFQTCFRHHCRLHIHLIHQCIQDRLGYLHPLQHVRNFIELSSKFQPLYLGYAPLQL